MSSLTHSSLQKRAAWFLLGLGLGVLLVLWVGGVTRLKGAGLSITTWDILTGILPPLTSEEWEKVFNLYQHSPEYRHLNWGLSLSDFKEIYGWEYAHRLLARFLSLICFIGLWRVWPDQKLRWQFFLLLILIGFQGVWGWIMVKSGLKQDPHVSPYLLSLHLMWAMGILGLMTHFFWKATTLLLPPAGAVWKGLLSSFSCFLILTLLWGAWVAGHKAGILYDTFPLMGNHFFPPEIWSVPLSQWISEPTCLISTHRLLAYATCVMGFFLGHQLSRPWRWSLWLLLSLQITLGAWISWSGVHWLPASLHQVNAAILVIFLVSLRFIRFSR